MDQMFK